MLRRSFICILGLHLAPNLIALSATPQLKCWFVISSHLQPHSRNLAVYLDLDKGLSSDLTNLSLAPWRPF